ncbi:MAG: FHA domain-containing protein [Deltaproteobacteria bacterium]|nr:FHA domain-containing protein [Deltaproteobacteria bacterium]
MAEEAKRLSIKQVEAEFKELGPIRFRQKFTRPVLIGIGRVAEAEEEENFAGRTMQVHLQDLVATMQDRGAPPSTMEAEQSSVSDLIFIIPYQTLPVRVGRKAGINAIVIPDYSLSATHCELKWLTHDTVALVDVGSSNPIMLGDRRLKPKENVPLRGGERIVLGRLIFRYFRPDQLREVAAGTPPDTIPLPPPR